MSADKHTPGPADSVAAYRKEFRSAMKWWRQQNPQYVDAKVRNDGWHGRAVFATVNHETCCLASAGDVMDAYRAHIAKATGSAS